VEEALFLDRQPAQHLDEERWMQLFSGNEKPWSRLNKQRVEKLIEQGIDDTAQRSQPQQDGSWSLLDAIEELKL